MNRILQPALNVFIKTSLLITVIVTTTNLSAQLTLDDKQALRAAGLEAQASLNRRLDHAPLRGTKIAIEDCMVTIGPPLQQFKSLSDQGASEQQLDDVRNNIISQVARCNESAEYLWSVNMRNATISMFDKDRFERCKEVNGRIHSSDTVRNRLDQLRTASMNGREEQLGVYGDLGYAAHLAHTMHTRARFLHKDLCHAPVDTVPGLNQGQEDS